MSGPLVIGITGGSGSGKSYFVRELVKKFTKAQVCLITQDNYYRERDEQPMDDLGIRNFDKPESINGEKLYQDLLSLKSGQHVEILEYTFNNPDITPKKIAFSPAPVLILEGLMVFYFEKIREQIDYSVFVDADELIKVKRRIIRDAKERGYDLDDVLYRYEHHVAPFYHQYLDPLKKDMDIVIPNNHHFRKGLAILEGFILNHLNTLL
jgi:uridine kinase